jgi:hypothetical protein
MEGTMLDLTQELHRPRHDAGWMVKVAVGSAFSLTILKWYLFPLACFAAGYVYRIFAARFKGEGEEKLPEWHDWKELFVTGLIFLLITIGYYLVPAFSFSLSESILMGGLLAKLVALVFLAVSALLFVGALFFLPMGLAQYTRHEQISSAFTVREIWDKIMNIGDDYFKITLLSALAIAALYVIRHIPVLGALLAALLGFYASLVFASLFGQLCRKAYAQETPTPPAESAESES